VTAIAASLYFTIGKLERHVNAKGDHDHKIARKRCREFFICLSQYAEHPAQKRAKRIPKSCI
jgi:hypothetical protein